MIPYGDATHTWSHTSLSPIEVSRFFFLSLFPILTPRNSNPNIGVRAPAVPVGGLEAGPDGLTCRGTARPLPAGPVAGPRGRPRVVLPASSAGRGARGYLMVLPAVTASRQQC